MDILPPAPPADETAYLMPANEASTFKKLDTMEQISVLATPALTEGSSSDSIDASPQKKANAKSDGKAHEFRDYVSSARQATVARHYRLMRENQTWDFVDRMYKKYHKFDHASMTVREAFEKLEGYVDSSDPDADFPNIEHGFQTAEGIRAAGHPDWFQLIGLIHDMGKMMFVWGRPEDGQQGTADGDQWALGGDTWAVGCRIPDSTVMPHLNDSNPDMKHPVYSTEMGVYEPGCGLKNVRFAYGHDEYLYRMLVHNKCPFPEQALAMVRLHSCYPWHSCGEYARLEAADGSDAALKKWVQEFNKFDLYTKADVRPDVDKLWPYYQKLIDKYMPGKLQW